jgi:methyl-accepting chemotaxis protein
MAMTNVKKTIGTNPFGVFEKSRSLAAKPALQVKPEGIPGLVQELGGAISDFSELNDSMGKNAHKLEKQTSHASNAAKQLAAHIQGVTGSLERIKGGIKKISTSVSSSTKSSLSALKAADSTNTVFSGFLDSSKELDKIDKIVATLAQQINIFALNASIEAARSGEAGRGFTVVANEIKELSKETFKIADDIRTKIDSFFADAKEAVNTMSEISNHILAIKNNQALIEEAIEEQIDALNETAKSTANITRSSNSVTDNVLNVYKLSKINTEHIEKTIRSSHSLNKILEDLSQQAEPAEGGDLSAENED